jgi:cobalt-zinc-cadmium efflux system membrane fusion protein
MNRLTLIALLPFVLVLGACVEDTVSPMDSAELAAATGDYERGPNNGRMLRDGDFALELAIFETGVPPEFRVWPTLAGAPVDLGAVDVEVRLTRLGNVVDVHSFRSQADFLRGSSVVYEPHSFSVAVEANFQGRSHQWSYESFEGRTRIAPDVAEAFGLETEIAGSAVIDDLIDTFGVIVTDPARVREISARFDGAIRAVDVQLGDAVEAGQRLATVESNESLQSYSITAPIGGIVTARAANAGEQTAGRALFTITDTSVVWAELAVFPSDRPRVAVEQAVVIAPTAGGTAVDSVIDRIGVTTAANQAVNARAVLDNASGEFPPGTHVTGTIRVAEYTVPLAVKRSGLQAFRDFTVVYAQIGDEYEVRMLDLGRQDDEYIEVLGGLEPGTRYVTENSFVLKADIEKSGATHDH